MRPVTDGKPKLLVTGASGKLGRRVVELLLEKQMAGGIVAMTRDPARLKDLAAQGVEVRAGDFDRDEALPAAFAGIDRLLLVSTDAVGRPGGRKAHHRAAVAAAVAAGVKHIVYTSGPSPHPDPDFGIADDHYWTEQAIAASPVGWTMLRDNLYAEVALMGLAGAVASGKLLTATRGGARGYVTREDCAQVAAAALADGFDGTRILDVSGPAAVTQAQLAAMASEVTGRPIEVVDMDVDGVRRALVQFGVPEVYAAMTAFFDREAAYGFYGMATPVVETLTGKPPMALKAFLEQNHKALLGEKA
jgi:NAD(P)H dehydrogenase (quinone)